MADNQVSQNEEDVGTVPRYTREELSGCLITESSFAILFPKYMESYIRECFPLVKKALDDHFIKAEVDLVEGIIKVSTTKKTWDPYIIFKARDMIRLMSRSVPYEQAVRVLEDDVTSDLINVAQLVKKKETFVKRRQRVIGPEGATLKAIELLTKCYILLQGSTCAIIGQHSGLLKARKIVTEAMQNIHPIYTIKTLMIMRELAKDPKLKSEDWGRFLPRFAVKNVKKKSRKIKYKKKEYTPFPPPPRECKIDKELMTGEYFLSDAQKKAQRVNAVKEESAKKSAERQKQKKKVFIPIDDPTPAKKPKKEADEFNIDYLKKKVTNYKKRRAFSPKDKNATTTSK